MYAIRSYYAIENDWEGNEIMRQHFLNCSKFGNDENDSDAMAIRVSENVREILESYNFV